MQALNRDTPQRRPCLQMSSKHSSAQVCCLKTSVPAQLRSFGKPSVKKAASRCCAHAFFVEQVLYFLSAYFSTTLLHALPWLLGLLWDPALLRHCAGSLLRCLRGQHVPEL